MEPDKRLSCHWQIVKSHHMLTPFPKKLGNLLGSHRSDNLQIALTLKPQKSTYSLLGSFEANGHTEALLSHPVYQGHHALPHCSLPALQYIWYRSQVYVSHIWEHCSAQKKMMLVFNTFPPKICRHTHSEWDDEGGWTNEQGVATNFWHLLGEPGGN